MLYSTKVDVGIIISDYAVNYGYTLLVYHMYAVWPSTPWIVPYSKAGTTKMNIICTYPYTTANYNTANTAKVLCKGIKPAGCNVLARAYWRRYYGKCLGQ